MNSKVPVSSVLVDFAKCSSSSIFNVLFWHIISFSCLIGSLTVGTCSSALGGRKSSWGFFICRWLLCCRFSLFFCRSNLSFCSWISFSVHCILATYFSHCITEMKPNQTYATWKCLLSKGTGSSIYSHKCRNTWAISEKRNNHAWCSRNRWLVPKNASDLGYSYIMLLIHTCRIDMDIWTLQVHWMQVNILGRSNSIFQQIQGKVSVVEIDHPT